MDNFFIASIAGFFSAIIGSMGMGGGGVLLLYLSLVAGVDHMKAQGINLAFFLPIAVVALVIHSKKKLISLKPVLMAVSAGIIGAWIGTHTAQYVGSETLSRLFGGLILIIGIKELFFTKNPKEDAQKKP